MYENDYIGKIVYIKNIVFAKGENKLDHAYNTGKPCLLIYSDEEYDYFLIISSQIKNKNYDFDYYKLNNDDFMYLYDYHGNNSRVKLASAHWYVYLRSIYKRKVSGFGMNDSGKIKLKTYKDIINKIKFLHNKENMSEIINNARVIGR